MTTHQEFLNDLQYVKRKEDEGENAPVGYIVSTNGPMAKVRWGVSDKRVYEEYILMAELTVIDYKIMSPAEVELRHAQEAGARIENEGDNNA